MNRATCRALADLGVRLTSTGDAHAASCRVATTYRVSDLRAATDLARDLRILADAIIAACVDEQADADVRARRAHVAYVDAIASGVDHRVASILARAVEVAL